MNSAHSASVFGRLGFGLSGKTTGVSSRLRVGLLLTLLLIVAATLSGCTIQPILAGPLQQAPLPTDQGPIIAVAPIAAVSGATVSVSGAGWQPEEVIFINLEGVQDGETVQATLATGTTDADGRFYVAFVTPLDFSLAGRGRYADCRLFAEQRRQRPSVPFALAIRRCVATASGRQPHLDGDDDADSQRQLTTTPTSHPQGYQLRHRHRIESWVEHAHRPWHELSCDSLSRARERRSPYSVRTRPGYGCTAG
jgi:hypothetical protein